MNVKAFKTFGDLAEHFINVSSNVSQVLQLLLGYLTDTIKSYLLNLLNETDVPALLVITRSFS
jgi:hypothetical protein